ncbi:MAG: hypothetical protein C5B50_23030 [Verrucomicrobia bacterium]|nr:MAG: hypothetical protein C5B50_23030 [Verrucomicrobiota bacterium]
MGANLQNIGPEHGKSGVPPFMSFASNIAGDKSKAPRDISRRILEVSSRVFENQVRIQRNIARVEETKTAAENRDAAIKRTRVRNRLVRGRKLR